MTSAGPRSFGKYLLEREIARGGMARVHLATLRGLGGFEKRLVVKEILPELASDPKFVAMFVEEAKVLVALSHPNIVPVYELGIVDGTYFLAMEHVEGATLADLVADAKLSPAEAARVGAEIADALAYAHERFDVVHRDVSPRNVMVDSAGHARLLDFGIAARADLYGSGPLGGPDATGSARQGGHSGRDLGEGDALYGTPGFLSPEQARGEKLGPASDLFSLGCVLAYATTGASPFGPKEIDWLRSLEAAPPVVIPDAPALERIVRELLAPDPASRPASARAAARALAAAASALEKDESAVALLAARASARPAPRGEEESAPSEGTAPVTPGARVETLAKSQALVAMLGDEGGGESGSGSERERESGSERERESGSGREGQSAAGTARIERARPVAAASPSRLPAIAITLVLTLAAVALVWDAQFELGSPEAVDPVDHGLTSPADIVPIPVEDGGDDDASASSDAGVPIDAARADDGATESDAGPDAAGSSAPPARDAGARGSATLVVMAYPWADVFVDGHPVGTAQPSLRVRIAPGAHAVRAVNPARTEERTIELALGQTETLRFNLE